MATTPEMLGQWFDDGVAADATHMIVVRDGFDYTDHPVYVGSGQDVRAIESEQGAKPFQRIMEVYCLSRDKAAQLAEYRAHHYDALS